MCPHPGTICVTGASGLVGRQVCRWLAAQGHVVVPTSRTGENACDLLDAGAVRKFLRDARPDILLHLAWHTGPDYAESPRNSSWLEAGSELARLFYEGGGRRFVGVGTCFEYQASARDLSEAASPARPETPYGRTKLELLRRLRALAGARSRSWAWARLFYLSGPGDTAPHRLVPGACAAFAEKRGFEVRNPEAVLDFMDIRDAGEALGRVALSPYEGVVNVGSGRGTSVGALVTLLAERMEAPDCVRLWQGGGGVRLVADVSVLRERIGFSPRHDIPSMLQAAAESHRCRRN